jgi:DNA modification methylase
MNWQLFTGDCAAVMREQIADGAIDLTVTSPPYDNLRKYNGYHFDFEAIAAELWRVTKPGGVVVWVVADATINGSETGTSFRQALHLMGLGFNLYDTMIWDKGVNVPTEGRYYNAFEFQFVFSKGKPNTLNLIVDKVNGSAGKLRKKEARIGNERRRYKDEWRSIKPLSRRSNVWRVASASNNIAHPGQFPEALARDHIISWSNPGDVVLDPMCGSGTTGKQAVMLGRRFIGIDISAEYVEGIVRPRIEKAAEQARQLELAI